MNRRSNQTLVSLAGVLSGCANFSNNLHEQTDYLPLSGSQADAEWNSESVSGEEIRNTYAKVNQLLDAAENHLEGTARQLQEPIPHFGIYATTRAALENSSRAWWLLDPTISHRERAGRGLAERFYNLDEAAKVERAMPSDDPTLDPKMNGKANRLAETAKSRGFEVIPTGRSGFRLVGFSRKPSTDLLRMLHGPIGEVVYRYLSAVVHGTTYGLLQDYDYEEDDRGGMGYVIKPNNDFGLIGFCVSRTLLTYCHAFDRQVFLYGWKTSEWHSWRLHVLGTIRPFISAGSES